MGKNLYYAYNAQTKSYIKSFGSQVMVTTNFSEATKHKRNFLEDCIKKTGNSDQWTIVSEGKARDIALHNQRTSIRTRIRPEKKTTPVSNRTTEMETIKSGLSNAIETGDIQYISSVEIAFSKDMLNILNKLISEKYEELSQKDLELSDVYHFILKHSPPAHIRTKVYGIQQKKLDERATIKDEISAIKKLTKMVKNSCFDEEIFAEREKIYTPRTAIYAELEALI